jgi:hypothetical protein
MQGFLNAPSPPDWPLAGCWDGQRHDEGGGWKANEKEIKEWEKEMGVRRKWKWLKEVF